MKIPDSVYHRIRDDLWQRADKIGWITLADSQKTTLYEEWLDDVGIGQVLSRYLDAGSIRVYIKDTIMKPYGRERLKDARPVFVLLGIPADSKMAKEFVKPHGRLLCDGRVVCWGLARDWKTIVLAAFERARRTNGGKPHAAVLMYPSGKTTQPGERAIIEEAARKLGVSRLVWHDG